MENANNMLNKCSEDLLRAPHRKRKTAEECQKPRVIKMVWDVDAETTSAMMENVGIAALVDESETTKDEMAEEMETGPKPTPPFVVPNDLFPPGAPKFVTERKQEATFTEKADFQQTVSVQYLPPLRIFMDSKTSSSLVPRSHNFGDDDFDPWNLLSDEVFVYLLSWLTKSVLVRCARVSRRWNRLAFDESLWKRLDLTDRTLQRGALGRVLDRGVAALRLSKTKIKSPLYLSSPSSPQPKVSRLQFLDLSMATINPTGLQELLSGCQHLRKLSLETCPVNDMICRYIAQNRNLEVLNLCMCQGITENALVPLCNSLKQLDSLNVGWTNMSRGAVVYLIICLPASVTKLNLSGCRETLQDDDILQLCNNCHSLKELDLSDATELTSKSVEHIIHKLSGLEYLALSRCYKILPSSLVLVRHIPTILALDVFGMLKETALVWLREALTGIEVNKFPFSSIARPTTGPRRSSIWGLRVRDNVL